MNTFVETLASYLPNLIVNRVVNNPLSAETPDLERLSAAIFFADISGFTGLTERLAQRGPDGVEELSQVLNTYFGQLLELIQLHGGDVVKFAGDGLLAIWSANNLKNLPQATLQAAHCGIIVQQRLHDYKVAEGLQLSLRIGIGAGEIYLPHLGGVYGRKEFLVTGAPLHQIRVAEHLASPGQVVISPEGWQLIKTFGEGQPMSDGYLLLSRILNPPLPRPLDPVSLDLAAEEALKAYIPGAILPRLIAGQTGWLAEIRRVTILFIHLPGLDYTTPLSQAQLVTQTLQNTLYRFEGSINKLSVDDKGVILVAALGLPPLAHEDDATRGVQAAMAVQARLQEMGLRSAIGVTTGRAFCGAIGNQKRREYTMIGDMVNLAARLMQAATDDLLCDSTTYQATRTHIRYEALSPISVKGKTELVAIFRPVEELKVNIGPRTAIVGRTPERMLLAEQLQLLLRGSRQRTLENVVIIEGEAGIGKSRLVEDFLQQAQAAGVTTFIGSGEAIESNNPYHSWQPVFNQLFNWNEVEEEPQKRQQHVLTQLAEYPELLRLAPLLNAVLSLDLAENELTLQMTGEVRADNTRLLLGRLLQKVAQSGPLVLVIEDAHWLDSASWVLTRYFSRELVSTLLVIVTRPLVDPVPPEYLQLLQITSTKYLKLGALKEEEALSLVCQRLQVASLPLPVRQFIRDKAEGHPFFSEELAYALRDNGLILIENGRCQLAPDAAELQNLDFPDTLQGVITSRIDRLTPSQQLTLKAASIIGRVFAYRILREIHPIESDKIKLADYLTTLEKLDLTPLDTSVPELAYFFKHIITQEVAYNLMLFSQRRALHRAVAEWFEQNYAEDLSPYYTLLAYHWRKTEETAKTVEYLGKAGEQALNNYANQEAVGFFTEALELATRILITESKVLLPAQILQQARWERQLGQAYQGLGDIAQSRYHLERAVELLGWPVPASKGQYTISLLRQIGWQILLRTPLQGLARPHRVSTQVLLEAARAYEGLTEIYYFANDSMALLNSLLRTVDLTEAVGLCPELARAYANMCIACGVIPLHSLAQNYSLRAQQSAQYLDQSATLGFILSRVGLYGSGAVKWSTVKEQLEQACKIFEELGNRRLWEESFGTLAFSAHYHSEFKRSVEMYGELYLAAVQTNHVQVQVWGLVGQAESLIPLARLDEASELVEKALTIFDEKLGRGEEIRLYGIAALVYARKGKFEQARKAAQRAKRLIGQTPPASFYTLEAYCGVAEVFLMLWKQSGEQSLQECIKQICQSLRRFARVFPKGNPRAWFYQGHYYWLLGETKKAKQAWQKSLRAAQQLELPYEEALAHYELGQYGSESDQKSHLERAIQLFAELEVLPDTSSCAINNISGLTFSI